MSDLPRLRDTEAGRTAGQLLSEAVEGLDRSWPATSQQEILRQLGDRVHGRPSNRPLAFSLATSLALLAIAIGVTLHRQKSGRPSDRPPDHPIAASGERRIALGSEAQLVLSPEAQLDLPPSGSPAAGRRLVLHRGRVCAEVSHRNLPKDGPLYVEAPQLRVVVIGTQFCVSTENGVSTVTVAQGRVRAEAPHGGATEVGPGESLRSDDPRLALAAPTLVPDMAAQPKPRPVSPECAEARSLDARRACYQKAARGKGLGAENGLFALGLLEEEEASDGPAALADWQAYEERFPEGVFAPEVLLRSLGELLNEKRYPEALTAAERYLASGEETTKPPIQLLRAQLLAATLGRPSEALPVFERLSETATPELRSEAVFSLAQCLAALGRGAEAKRNLQRYLAEFPQGSHAADARSLLP